MKIKQILNIFTIQDVHLHQHEFTKNNKTIIFQEMMHIAPANIYEQINKDIKSFLTKNNSMLFLEGVRGSKKETKQFTSLLLRKIGITMQDEKSANLGYFYSFLSKNIDWVNQNKRNYIKGIDKDKIIQADIQAVELIEKLKNIPDFPKQIIVEKKQLVDISHLFKKVLSFKITKWLAKQIIKNNIKNKQFFERKAGQVLAVILNERNHYLLQCLEENQSENIFITYGALHLLEIKEELLKKGYKHQIIKRYSVH